MKLLTPAPNDTGYRFAPEIISHGVWLSFRFSLSYRDIEELMAERGITLTWETVRQWCLKFGQRDANEPRRRRPHCAGKWHLDEVLRTINGQGHSLWRAVDHHGNVLDILVQSRGDKKAAKRFLRKLLKGLEYVPRVSITEKLASYGAAKRELLPSVEHRQPQELGHPGGKLASTDQTTGRHDARLPIRRTCATLPLGLGPISDHFRPRWHRSARSGVSCDHARPLPHLGGGHRSAKSGIP